MKKWLGLTALLLCVWLSACNKEEPLEENASIQEEMLEENSAGQEEALKENVSQQEEAEIKNEYDKNGDGYITNDEVNLREMVVKYMEDMAGVEWTATKLIDYTSEGFPLLVYKPGEKYLGMIYNSSADGFEVFQEALDEQGNFIAEDTYWTSGPGNSCATSIRHAWQLIAPSVEYQYSADMAPYYAYTGVTAVGDVDWSTYADYNTVESIVKKTDKAVIMEAYAQMLPGDAFVRFLYEGGHAQMLTKEVEVVRDNAGNILPAQSYVYITEQNCLLNNIREYPSSWLLDYKMTFQDMYDGGYLPVSCKELQEGKTPIPTFELRGEFTSEDVLSTEKTKAYYKSNYVIMRATAEIREGDARGELIETKSWRPYYREFELQSLKKDMDLQGLPAGTYYVSIYLETGLGSETVLELEFTK